MRARISGARGTATVGAAGNPLGFPVSLPRWRLVEGPTAPTKDPWGKLRVGVSAPAKISRKEFGLTWNAALEAGGVMIGDEVTITLDVEFVKAD